MVAFKEISSETSDFSTVQQLNTLSKVPIPASVTELFTAPILHDTVIESADMEETVKAILHLKD